MIIDRLENIKFYFGIDKDIEIALKFLEKNNFLDVNIGRYEFSNGIYFMVQEYKTKTIRESFWEAHRRYIDVQYVIRGAERMGYANIRNLEISQEYMEDKDCLILSGDGDFFTVYTGNFAIFYPEDAHMPCLTVKEPRVVKKVVVKIPVE